MGPILSRNLTEQEEIHLFSLQDWLSHVYIPKEIEDNSVWAASQDGGFSVASFFSSNTRSFSTISPIYRLENEGSPRVLVSSWLALHGMILTIDNLCAAEIGSWLMLAPVLGG